MGHRLSKIYTRTGDDGTTGLANGERVDKADRRVEAFGDVDETNSALGLLLAEADVPPAMRRRASRASSTSCSRSAPSCRCRATDRSRRSTSRQLEHDLDELNAELPPLKEFVLPGGTRAAAICHLARTICRRAERSAWAANDLATLNPELLRYLNRLSDLLFVMARCLARQNGGQETLWQRS